MKSKKEEIEKLKKENLKLKTVNSRLKKDYEQIKKIEEGTRAFIQNTTEGIWLFELKKPVPISLSEDEQIDLFYKYCFLADCNDAYIKMYGYNSKEKLIGIRLADIMPKEQKENVEYLRNFIRNNYKLENGESVEFDKEGNPKYFSNNLIGIIENGKLMRAWGSQRDITQIKISEDKLEKSEIQYRTIFENAQIGIFRTAPDGKILIANPYLIQMLEYDSLEELQEINLNSSGYQNPSLRKEFMKLIEGNGEARSFESTWLTKTGKTIFVSENAKAIKDERGNILFYEGTVEDITERKRAELIRRVIYKISDAVHKTDDLNELYKLIHENIGTLMPADNFYISIYDWENDLLSFPYFVDKYEQPPAPIILNKGLTAYVLKTGQALLATPEVFNELLKKGEVEDVGVPSIDWLGVPLKKGEETFGAIVIQTYDNNIRLTNDDKEILNFVSEQIAMAIERKMFEEKLMETTEELMRANSEKDRFFSIIAHDLRSPFHSLFGFSEMLATELNNLSNEEITFMSSEIYKGLKNLYNLLENLLEWSRLERDKIEFQPSEFNLSELVNEVYELLRHNAYSKNINVINNVDENCSILADRNMIKSVIQNLVSNAIKFSYSEGKIIINAERKNLDFIISVEDDGMGIRQEDLTKLFKIDFQLSTIGTAQEKGTGLGLILCKELIEKHKGKIWVESELNKGSKFFFTIPQN
ncbi:MAG: hypothetical protein STSR0008_16670 [Ignavibacterium sp.]